MKTECRNTFFSAMMDTLMEMGTDSLQSLTSDPCGKVPVEHLDYDYIEKCKDVKYVEKLLRVLR